MTNTQLKTQVDADITNKTSAKSISPLNVGKNIKDLVDYVDQEIESNSGDTQIIKNIKVTLTPFEVSNLFTNPVKVINRVSGKSIKPIQMTVLSNNLTAGYSPNGGQLILKYEDLPTAILDCNTGLGSFGDTECSDTANSLSAGGYSSLFKHVFVKLASANPVGGDGGLILYITYVEITL
jgi:hypothetical protein